jgi:hypothetical protein
MVTDYIRNHVELSLANEYVVNIRVEQGYDDQYRIDEVYNRTVHWHLIKELFIERTPANLRKNKTNY